MAHVGVSVNEATKENWEEYVEGTDYGSISELVRSAVRKEIARESGGDGIPREVEAELTEVAETQATLREQMADLLDGFEDVEAATATQYPSEIVELGHDIAGGLEEVHADRFADWESETQSELWDVAQEQSGNVSVGEVKDALEYLEENLSYVRAKPRGPSEYYRVRGETASGRNRGDE